VAGTGLCRDPVPAVGCIQRVSHSLRPRSRCGVKTGVGQGSKRPTPSPGYRPGVSIRPPRPQRDRPPGRRQEVIPLPVARKARISRRNDQSKPTIDGTISGCGPGSDASVYLGCRVAVFGVSHGTVGAPPGTAWVVQATERNVSTAGETEIGVGAIVSGGELQDFVE